MASKINQLLQNWPNNTVATARWLRSEGVDHRLADKYVRSGWLVRLAHGAYIRAGSDIDWPSGVYALQNQLGLGIHIGAITALELRGYTHYLALRGREVILFGHSGVKLPKWFIQHHWSQPVKFITSNTFQNGVEYTSVLKMDGIELITSSLEQAVLEMMYLVPDRQSYEEAVRIMESLTTLRPNIVQELLEGCSSVKTKRLFMHVAELCELPWLSQLELSRVNFGSGRRSIHTGGKLYSKYNLVVADSDSEVL